MRQRWIAWIVIAGLAAMAAGADVAVVAPKDSPNVAFGVARLAAALKEAGQGVVLVDPPGENLTQPVQIVLRIDPYLTGADNRPLAAESYRITRSSQPKLTRIAAAGTDAAGASYAAMDLAEQVRCGTALTAITDKTVSPRLAFRAIKFNLPWDSYRTGEALAQHTETCRDLKFWRAFLDMMAENRFNALTLWNLHPFPYMIRPKDFPEACPFSDAELAEWQKFWHELFKMAAERGIKTYIVNWNIFVSPAFAKAHNVCGYCKPEGSDDFGPGESNDLVKRYMKQCIRQTLEEYPELTGLGTSLGEQMNAMTPQERQDWVDEVYLETVKQIGRKVEFIHRAPFSIDPQVTRQSIEASELPNVLVELKFNWSHGHSTPNLAIVHGGAVDDGYWNPPPGNYKIAWMVRNEDFFVLRWGEPEFIRRHIRTNTQPYVGGYFIGSECYIPAKEYAHKEGAFRDWTWAFEKQWLYYRLWGRLLYDPETPDAVFAADMNKRFGFDGGDKLLKGWSAASKMPLALASFFAASWDFTLYSEGFLAPVVTGGLDDKASPFISVDEMIDHTTLDPKMYSIKDYVDLLIAQRFADETRITPMDLADMLEQNARVAQQTIDDLKNAKARNKAGLQDELEDIRAWAHLNAYFADKLRGAVAVAVYRRNNAEQQRDKAVEMLTACLEHWDGVIAATKDRYKPVPLMHLDNKPFHWSLYSEEVKRDLEALQVGDTKPTESETPKPAADANEPAPDPGTTSERKP